MTFKPEPGKPAMPWPFESATRDKHLPEKHWCLIIGGANEDWFATLDEAKAEAQQLHEEYILSQIVSENGNG